MIHATAHTSKWETERVNAGISGVGSTYISFDVCDATFNVQVNRFYEAIDSNNWKPDGTNRGGKLSTSVIGYYTQPIVLSDVQVLSLLASVFEYEGVPLNPYRFRAHRMHNAVTAYAKLVKKDLKVFVRGYLYPLPHFHYGDDNFGYKEEREKIFQQLGV